jgi:hypothetical protein
MLASEKYPTHLTPFSSILKLGNLDVRFQAGTRIAGPLVLMMVLFMLVPDRSVAQSADPAREFLDGNRRTFSTKDHPKAKGINLAIAYPGSWAAAEGERPNIVQKFVSHGGRGLESAMIITKDLPLPAGTILTKEDMRDMFTVSELRGMLPDGAIFVGAQSTEIEGVPAATLEYVTRAERAGVEIQIHAWMLSFISGKTLVQLQFGVAGSTETENDVFRRMAAFKPLFILMANSIVLPDEWPSGAETPPNTTMPASTTSARSYGGYQLSTLNAVANLVITWGLGITPPLLIRYVLVRRPLSKRAASWLAAGFSVFFWTAFLSLNHALHQKPGTGAVWVIMFFVARWIMSRGQVAHTTIAGRTDFNWLRNSN